MQNTKNRENILHLKVHCSRVWYDSIDDGEHFQPKLIQVKPDASLSLPKHHRIVLAVHLLATLGIIPVKITSVYTGSYIGEDDIVRFEDTYGRVQS